MVNSSGLISGKNPIGTKNYWGKMVIFVTLTIFYPIRLNCKQTFKLLLSMRKGIT